MIKNITSLSSSFRRALIAFNINRGFALELDLAKLSGVTKTQAEFSQSDVNTSIIAIQLMFNGKPLSVPSGAICYANVKITGKHEPIINECEILDASNAVIKIQLSTDALKNVGEAMLEIVISGDDKKIVSPKISYTVVESFDIQNGQPAENQLTVLDTLINRVSQSVTETSDFNELMNANENQRIINENQRIEAYATMVQTYNNQIVVSNEEIDRIIATALQ
ncbi:MAG: BppU family phage baseplate upper protein [Romboutsia timonensis]